MSVEVGSKSVGHPPAAATWSQIPLRQLNLRIQICQAPGTHASLRYVKCAVKHPTCPVIIPFLIYTKVTSILAAARLNISGTHSKNVHFYKSEDRYISLGDSSSHRKSNPVPFRGGRFIIYYLDHIGVISRPQILKGTYFLMSIFYIRDVEVRHGNKIIQAYISPHFCS